MTARKPAPTSEQISVALAKSGRGQGRPLAELVKSFSVDDLASAFGHIGSRYSGCWHGLHLALEYAAGRKSQRAEQARFRAAYRKGE